jgi:transposase
MLMSLRPQEIPPVPEETVRVARAAFPKGSICMHLRDAVGTIYADQDFAALFPVRGQPAAAPWRLALICVLQFVEGLSDRQTADAVRGRIDWKYALGLELTDPGFDFSVLSEFRDRVLAGGAEQLLLEAFLRHCVTRGWVRERGAQRTDSTHVLAAVRTLNRIETVGETLRMALNALAAAAPGWLRVLAPAAWFDRYGRRVEEERLPKGLATRQAYAATIGADGAHLLTALYAPAAPDWLRQLPAVEVLRQVWVQQYVVEHGAIRWRTAEELPPAGRRIESPYDAQAHFACKGSTAWTGYKVHLTESCDPQEVHLITDVATTPSHHTDASQAAPIQEALGERGLLPGEHLLDTGYIDADFILDSQATREVDVVGPVRPDSSWQAQTPGSYDLSRFTIDWAARTVICPERKVATTWTGVRDRDGHPAFGVRFPHSACDPCPVRARCTRSATTPRHLTLRPQAAHELLQAQRQLQATPAWQVRYQRRAGIEGTISQGVRAFELRCTRYRGLPKTRLQHILTAVAINVVRLVAWLQGVTHAPTRVSHFAALAPRAA